MHKAIKIFDFGDGTGFPELSDNIRHIVDIDNKKKNSVICLIGQARMGKSFFLNCFNQYITDSDDEIFKTKSDLEHCTKNVNVHCSGDYILIDCQGLKYENSKNDDKLLLIAYTLSDVVIINGIKTLDNTLFSYIEPISVYLHFLTKSKPREQKPILVFKIMDYQFEDQPKEKIANQLRKLMKDSDDNYQTLRNTLKLLFRDVCATYTMSPDREDKRKFLKKDFRYVLENDELNFKGAITDIISMSKKVGSTSEPISWSEFVEKCNNLYVDMAERKKDKSFDIAESDLSKLTVEKRCITYYNQIRDQQIYIDGKTLPNPNRKIVDDFIGLDVTSEDIKYSEIFVPNIEKIMDIYEKFNDEFEDVDPNVVLQTFVDLIRHMFSGIMPKLSELKKEIEQTYNGLDINNIIEQFMIGYNKGIDNYPQYNNIIADLDNLAICIKKYCEEQMAHHIHFNEKVHIVADMWVDGKRNKYSSMKSKILDNLYKNNNNHDAKQRYKTIIDEIKSSTETFIDLCNFDANVLITELVQNITDKVEKIKNYHMKNMECIERAKNGNTEKLKKYLKEKYVVNYILSNEMKTDMTFDQNVAQPIKTIILDDLKKTENEHIVLAVISSVNITLGTNVCTIPIKIISIHPSEPKSLVRKMWENLLTATYSIANFNLHQQYYDSIDFNKLFQKKNIVETYVRHIRDIVIDEIQTKPISYDKMEKIREVNGEIKFISFSNSSDYHHNLLRNYVVPNGGYILVADSKYVDDFKICDQIHNITMECILKFFGDTNGNITFNYIDNPNCKDNLLKHTLQQIIINIIACEQIQKQIPIKNVKNMVTIHQKKTKKTKNDSSSCSDDESDS
jgi:hypothetical protein